METELLGRCWLGALLGRPICDNGLKEPGRNAPPSRLSRRSRRTPQVGRRASRAYGRECVKSVALVLTPHERWSLLQRPTACNVAQDRDYAPDYLPPSAPP